MLAKPIEYSKQAFCTKGLLFPLVLWRLCCEFDKNAGSISINKA